LIVAGAALRFFRLDHQSLWWDEAWQFYVCGVDSLQALFDRLLDPSTTANPPGSHLVSFAFLNIDRSDVFLRLPSVLFGILSLPVMYGLGRRLIGSTAALYATAVMAFSPYHVHYSQEARMYAMLMFVSLVSTWLLVRAVDRNRPFHWVLYALSIAVGIYTHVWASLGILSHGLWILFSRRDRLGPYVASGAATVAAFLPMLRFFLARVGVQRVPHGGAGSGFTVLPYAFFVYSVGLSLGPSVFELRNDRSMATLGPHLPVIALVLVLFGALFLIGEAALVRRDSKRAALVLLGAGVPVVGVFAASFIPSMTFNVRYTSWAFPFFAMVIGAGLHATMRSRPRVGTSLVAAVAALFAVSLVNYYTSDIYAKEDVRAAVASWREQDTGGVLFSYYGFPTVDRYLTPLELERHHPIWGRGRTPERIREVVSETDNRRDAFVLLARDWHEIVETFTRREFTVLDEQAFRGGVRLLRIRAEDVPTDSI
jgi:4-amino-4-deoxy-L-arabinose transferase-like glycosyltransferase